MRLSERVRSIVGEGPDGWGILYRAWEMQRAGEPVVMLTIGDHDVTTDPFILDAMKAAMDAGVLGYAPMTGTPELRRAVAERQNRAGHAATKPDDVVVTPGGQAALFAAMTAVLDPGDAAIVLDPYYATYLQTVRAAGGRPRVVATRPADGFQPDPDAIGRAIGPATRAILLNTPNNPTGAVYTAERLEAIAALARRHDLWIISDEVYRTMLDAGARHLSPRDLPGMAERVIVVDSLSKSHAMTGSRLGWTVAPRPAADRIGELAVTTNYGVPGFIQHAAAVALTTEDGARIEREIAARYARRRDVALKALGDNGATPVVPPAGAMYVMADVRGTGLGGDAFAARLLSAERIAVMPGESFGRATAGQIRIALTVKDAILERSIATLARFASSKC